jgi:hypothetical protein
MTNDPVLIAYTAKRHPDTGRTIWARIGRAYPHEIGNGLNVVLDALPVNGRLILLEPGAGDESF